MMYTAQNVIDILAGPDAAVITFTKLDGSTRVLNALPWSAVFPDSDDIPSDNGSGLVSVYEKDVGWRSLYASKITEIIIGGVA